MQEYVLPVHQLEMCKGYPSSLLSKCPKSIIYVLKSWVQKAGRKQKFNQEIVLVAFNIFLAIFFNEHFLLKI